MSPATDTACSVAGIVAAEATFVVTGRRFRFAVALAASDRMMCDYLYRYFGVGRMYEYPRRQPHYDDEIVYVVQRLTDHVEVIVPFMDEHLPPSHKRQQYLVWRTQLLDYWEHHARRRRTCSIEGCDRPQRAKGLCRHHYFVEYRR